MSHFVWNGRILPKSIGAENMNSRLLFLVPGLLALAACSDNSLVVKDGNINDVDDSLVPDIAVSPESHTFGALPVDGVSTETQEFVVTNNGDAALQITSIELDDSNAPFTLSAIGNVLLEAGGTTAFTVTFQPITAEAVSATVYIGSNDPDEPSVPVALDGGGIAPQIELAPVNYDYGTRYIGCPETVPLTVRNIGNADLIVSALDYISASPTEIGIDRDASTATNGPLPWTLAPGTELQVQMLYSPLDDYGDDGYLTVTSNDPNQPAAQAHQAGLGALYGENNDIFEQPLRGETDILWALDWSCSMADDIAQVQTNFDVYIGTLAGLDADYHVAAVTDDSGCILGDVDFIDGSYTSDEQQAIWDIMQAGPGGAYTEMGFTLFEAALSGTNIGRGGCNEDFYRDDAKLNLIDVTDEVEQSANTWDYYVTLFQGYKADPADVVFHGIAGDYPSGCGSAEPGRNLYEAVVATGGTYLSICATDWGSSMTELAEGAAADLSSFALTQTPVPATIEVYVDGIRTTEGWTYNETEVIVEFDDDHIPGGGTTVEISYATAGDCAS